MTCLLQTSHPSFRRLVSQHKLDPSKLGRRAALPSSFAAAFLGVLRDVLSTVLVQLRFDYIRCFGGFAPGKSAAGTLGLYCGSRLAGGKDATPPIWQSSGSRVRPQPSCARYQGRCESNPGRLCAVAGSIDRSRLHTAVPSPAPHTIQPV